MGKKESLDERFQKVVKANALIQKSRFSLSTQEQKIILYLITKIKPCDEDFKLYEFSIFDFCHVCGIHDESGKTYADLKKSLQKLSDKSIWITLEDGRQTLLRWIERPFIEPNKGVVQIKLDNLMKPFLLKLQDNFTQYTLFYTLAMRSKYSIRIYELLKSYQHKGLYECGIEDFKKQIYAEAYKQHADFKRYVVETAIREMNEFSDLNVSHSFEKTGRKFTKIIFFVTLKDKQNEKKGVRKKIEARLAHRHA